MTSAPIVVTWERSVKRKKVMTFDLLTLTSAPMAVTWERSVKRKKYMRFFSTKATIRWQWIVLRRQRRLLE